ncbi:MAG TPA: hypothetical protein VKT33_09535 [Candidatus Angelobacter sp.]|nr:hypothetical protein [Candidatus Angelobacter sp.]
METILQNLRSVDEAIQHCLTKLQILPALILVYAAIDIVASLEGDPTEGVQKSFTRWVDLYMLPNPKLECTALEIYSARCGMVHTLTADSNLSRQGKARIIMYAWGNAVANDLKESTKRLGRTSVIVHVSDLHEAFQSALLKWEDDVKKDAQRSKRVEANLPASFVNIHPDKIKTFLAGSKS